jgi:hypothetical protein
MFKVTNKIDVDLKVRDVEILNQFKKIGLFPGKQDYSKNGNIPTYNWIELAERLENAVKISYNAPANLALEPLTVEELEELQKPSMSVSRFYKFFASRNLGFYELLPQETAKLEHNPELIADLISKSLAKNITIEDTQTDQVVYDGGTKKVKIKDIGWDGLGKRAEIEFEVEEVCNLLHPELKNELHYSKDDSELAKVKKEYEELFGRKPNGMAKPEKIQAEIDAELNKSSN